MTAAGQQNSDDADYFLPQRVAPHLISTILCIKPTQPKRFADTCGERVYWSIYTSPAFSTGLHFGTLGLAAKAYLSPLTQEILREPAVNAYTGAYIHLLRPLRGFCNVRVSRQILSPLTQEICEHPRGMRILENGYLSCIIYGIAF
jgi:hypothetical protein